MHEIDENSKTFFAIPSNFADLVNGVVFNGRPVIDPKDLLTSETERISEDEKKSFYVDVAKKWILKNVKVTLITIENQNYVDYGMVIRNMRTELLSYINQMNEIKEYHKSNKDLKGDEYLSNVAKSDLLTPVITVVVYLGEKPWDGPRELYDILDMDKNLEMAVNNFKLNLFDYHDYDDISMFNGEVYKLINILKIRDDKNKLYEYVHKNKYIKATTGKLIYSLVGLKTENVHYVSTMKGDVIDMCKGLADLCADERQAGIEQGIEKGIEGIIRSCKELIGLKEVAIEQLLKTYDMSRELAEEKVEKYW